MNTNLGNVSFNLPKGKSSIIKVIGVGGGGSNAVNNMYREGIANVDFIVCNTDNQALDLSPVPIKIRLGDSGLGAGANPKVGRQAALDNLEQVKDVLKANTKMLFIAAGMGGGTGTGAAPVVAQVARELGILTVGIVTTPFKFEGLKRVKQANEGICEMRNYVDTLLVISNNKIREIYGQQKLGEAFAKVDHVLTIAAKSIAETITKEGNINLDFEDVKSVLQDSKSALMGYGIAEGDDRAMEAVRMALESPLLDDNNIHGAQKILLRISSGSDEITDDELEEIAEYVQEVVGAEADMFLGTNTEEDLGNKVAVTIVATGFPSNADTLVNARAAQNAVVPPKREELYGTTPQPQPQPQPQYQPQPQPQQRQQVCEKMTSDAMYGEVEVPNRKVHNLYDDVSHKQSVMAENEYQRRASRDEIYMKPQTETMVQSDVIEEVVCDDSKIKLQRRNSKLHNYGIDLYSRDQVERYEREPAYKRREVELVDVAPSDESAMSSSSLDRNTYVYRRNNNRFLNPNVD